MELRECSSIARWKYKGNSVIVYMYHSSGQYVYYTIFVCAFWAHAAGKRAYDAHAISAKAYAKGISQPASNTVCNNLVALTYIIIIFIISICIISVLY